MRGLVARLALGVLRQACRRLGVGPGKPQSVGDPGRTSTAEAAGKPELLVQTGDFEPLSVTITADGKRLAFLKMLMWQDVYLAELGSDGASVKSPRRLTLDNRGSVPSG
jgi:hypothetical protein